MTRQPRLLFAIATLSTCWLLLVMALTAPVAWADGKQKVSIARAEKLGYSPTNSAVYRSGLSGADSTTVDHANTLALEKIECGGFQSVSLHGRFTVASASAVCLLIRYNLSDVVVSTEEFTLTAKATWTLDSLYHTNIRAVDTEGCAYVRVVIAAPSSGNLDLWAGSY